MSLHAAAPQCQEGSGARAGAGGRGGGGRDEERASQLTYNLCRERKRKIPPPSPSLPPPRRPFSPKRPLARSHRLRRPTCLWMDQCTLLPPHVRPPPTASLGPLTGSMRARVRRIGRGSMPGKEGGRKEGPAPRVRDRRRRRRRERLPAVAWHRASERASRAGVV